ncbi:MAG: hypothetical protein QHH06_02615 [Clostridiales bacterium]|nr:hypothetical protein [Eubacteriales bacterium]MDH7565363.1 hypothetical protein [Clostridiales bacterium]
MNNIEASAISGYNGFTHLGMDGVKDLCWERRIQPQPGNMI